MRFLVIIQTQGTQPPMDSQTLLILAALEEVNFGKSGLTEAISAIY